MSDKTFPTQLRDKCNRLQGLIQCLQFVLHHPDLPLYHERSQDILLETIDDIIAEIDKGLETL